MVVTMGGLTRDGSWEDYDYLPFSMLRKYWKNAVLKLIRRTLGKSGTSKEFNQDYKLRTRTMEKGFT